VYVYLSFPLNCYPSHTQTVCLSICTSFFSVFVSSRASVAQLIRARDCQSLGRRVFRLQPDNSNSHGFELHRPSNKGTKLLLKVIKVIIIICHSFSISITTHTISVCLSEWAFVSMSFSLSVSFFPSFFPSVFYIQTIGRQLPIQNGTRDFFLLRCK